MAKTPQGQINVCLDCFLMAVNGETEGTPDREPWGEMEGVDATPGVLEHDEVYCPTMGEGDFSEHLKRDSVCYCEEEFFSWHTCPACGSTLGGDRFPMVWWA